jgi:N-sulfoglucosamine sulfohydrolase
MRVEWLFHRPAEELYDLARDPDEMHNLAADPQYSAIKNRLRGQLDAWMLQQGDLGMQTELLASSRQGKSDEAPAKPKRNSPRAN